MPVKEKFATSVTKISGISSGGEMKNAIWMFA
jgi:hypothetical protein